LLTFRITHIAKNAANIKLVLIISCQSLEEARGTAIRNIIAQVSKLVCDFTSYLTSVVVLFTHVKPKKAVKAWAGIVRELAKLLDSISKESEEAQFVRHLLKHSQAALTLVKDNKTLANSPVHIIYPLTSSSQIIFSSITECPHIVNPVSVFKNSLSQRTEEGVVGNGIGGENVSGTVTIL